MNNSFVLNFIKLFFTIFQAEIKNYKFEGNKVFGTLIWNDDPEWIFDEEQTQDFSWTNNLNDSEIIVLSQLFEYLLKHNLVSSDKIIISEIELIDSLINAGWRSKDVNDCIYLLESFEINMVDDGEETDKFYFHF